MSINPIEIQKHLEGADYPASKDDLISLAESNGASEEILEQLREVEDRERFNGPDDVMEALGGPGE